DDEANFFVRSGQFIGVAMNWSKAQDRSLTQQLNDGMRYLDLRACIDLSGNYRICHGMYGPLMSDLLDQIATSAGHHPREIVLVSMGGFKSHTQSNNAFTEAEHNGLVQLITQHLGSHLLDKAAGDVAPTMTLNQIWTHSSGTIAIIYTDGTSRSTKFLD